MTYVDLPAAYAKADVQERVNLLNAFARAGTGARTELMFGNVAQLLADTSMGYASSAARVVAAGTKVQAAMHLYDVAASGASDHHVTTAGGVKLYVLPGDDGVYPAPAFGSTQAALSAALNVAAGATVALISAWAPTSSVTMSTASVRVIGRGGSIAGTSAVSSFVLRVNAANVVLEDFAASVDNTTADVISLGAGLAAGFRARRLTVTGGNYGMSPISNTDIWIDGCSVSGAAQSPIRLHNIADTAVLSNLRVTNCTLDTSAQDPATAASPCLLVRGTTTRPTTGVVITGNTFLCPTDPTNSASIGCEIRWCNGAVFEANYGRNGAMLVSVAGSSDVTVGDNATDGATFYGIEVASPTVALACNNVTVTGNAVSGQGRLNYGIGVQGLAASTGLTISGNSIRGTVDWGIFVTSFWDELTIVGNRVDMGAVSAEATQAAIFLTGGDNVAIGGNVLDGGGVVLRGIRLSGVTEATVSGNTTTGFTTNDVLIAEGTGTNNLAITGNTFGSGLGAAAIASSGTMGIRISAVNNPGFTRSGAERIDVLDWLNDVIDAVGTAAPEGSLTAGGGSVYRRRGGGAGATWYVKEDAAIDATGWAAK